MEKHFVESHSGGYYFSSEDPSIIEGLGEDYGNGDNIAFTFDDEIEDEPLKSLAEYFTKDLIFNKEKLLEKLYSFHMDEVGIYAAFTEVTCNAIYDIDTNKDILKALLEEEKIDKEMYNLFK